MNRWGPTSELASYPTFLANPRSFPDAGLTVRAPQNQQQTSNGLRNLEEVHLKRASTGAVQTNSSRAQGFGAGFRNLLTRALNLLGRDHGPFCDLRLRAF